MFAGRKKRSVREEPAWRVAMREEHAGSDQAGTPRRDDREQNTDNVAALNVERHVVTSGGQSQDRSQDRSRSRSRDRSPGRKENEGLPHFLAANSFGGFKTGYVFKRGESGLGYYVDVGSAAGSVAAERDTMARALESQGVASMSDENADTPIMAALSSHQAELDTAERATRECESEVSAAGWGRVGASLRHRAEVIEVRLTDQLMQLTTMLDDCETVEGRTAVKAAIARLRALGARLLKITRPH